MKRLVLDWTFEFPDPQCPWLNPVTRYAKAFSREEIPEVIWAEGRGQACSLGKNWQRIGGFR